MPEQTKNAAVSGEWKLVPVAQLKKWHRDLDACQRVMWLRGGFDPAYCMDAQDCLKQMDVALSDPVPPAGGDLEVLASIWHGTPGEVGLLWSYIPAPAGFVRKIDLVDREHVTRLQAENAALQRKLTKANLSCHDLAHKLADKWGSVQGAQFETVKALRYLNEELQQRLNTADQRVDELQKDKERLDALEANYWDVRHHSSALGDTGDYTSCVEIVGHWMDKPNERVIGENYNENLRAAIDQAMTADAYPPARPEYPELDAALAEEDWHMNPCKQGHRDVGACQGRAFCHTCDETITAETTQQAFEQWNSTHPPTANGDSDE